MKHIKLFEGRFDGIPDENFEKEFKHRIEEAYWQDLYDGVGAVHAMHYEIYKEDGNWHVKCEYGIRRTNPSTDVMVIVTYIEKDNLAHVHVGIDDVNAGENDHVDYDVEGVYGADGVSRVYCEAIVKGHEMVDAFRSI